MRLHVKMPAPSVLKVLMFVAEAGQEIETVEVGDTHSQDFLRMNPFGTVPVLEAQEGDYIAESLTICRYLDRLWGRTGLFGQAADEELRVEQWERHAELLLFLPALEHAHHSHPMFAPSIRQLPGYAQLASERLRSSLDIFECELRDRRFVAGTEFSIADITAYLGVATFAALGGFKPPAHSALHRWSSEVADRASGHVLRSAVARIGQ